MTFYFIIVIISILASAYFSGMEIAFVSSNRLFIAVEKSEGGWSGKILDFFSKNANQYITSMLIGNNIALVVYGMYFGKIMTHYTVMWIPVLHDYFVVELLVHTLFSTLVILITAEYLPKSVFSVFSMKMLKYFAIPTFIFYWLFYFIAKISLMFSKVFLIILGVKGEKQDTTFNKIDLENFLAEQIENSQQGEKLETEIQIFQNALEFDEIKARECMIPRNEILALEVNQSVEELKAAFIDSGFSKLLIYEDKIDEIIGYVHSHDIFLLPKQIRQILRPVEFVNENMLIKSVLKDLIVERKSIAVVTDEYGGVAGMITIEDIVEELVGEIEDEHDSVDLSEVKLDDENYIFSARLEIDYINDTYNLNLPEGEEYETLGGLIVHLFEDIPPVNEEIVTENHIFTIKKVEETKIDMVEVKIV